MKGLAIAVGVLLLLGGLAVAGYTKLRPTQVQCEQAFVRTFSDAASDYVPEWITEDPALSAIAETLISAGGIEVARGLRLEEVFTRKCMTTMRRWKVQAYIEGRRDSL